MQRVACVAHGAGVNLRGERGIEAGHVDMDQRQMGTTFGATVPRRCVNWGTVTDMMERQVDHDGPRLYQRPVVVDEKAIVRLSMMVIDFRLGGTQHPGFFGPIRP